MSSCFQACPHQLLVFASPECFPHPALLPTPRVLKALAQLPWVCPAPWNSHHTEISQLQLISAHELIFHLKLASLPVARSGKPLCSCSNGRIWEVTRRSSVLLVTHGHQLTLSTPTPTSQPLKGLLRLVAAPPQPLGRPTACLPQHEGGSGGHQMHILWPSLPHSALPQFSQLLTQPLPEEVLENFQTHKDKARPPLLCSFSCQYGPSSSGPSKLGNFRSFSDQYSTQAGPPNDAIPTELELGQFPSSHHLEPPKSRHPDEHHPLLCPPCSALPNSTAEVRSHVLCL